MTTWSEAKRSGLVHYDGGSECKHGHGTLRYTSSGSCVKCVSIRQTRRDVKQYQKDRYIRDKKKLSMQARVRYEKKRAEKIEYSRVWADKNPERVKLYKSTNKYKRRQAESNGCDSGVLIRWRSRQKKVCYICGEVAERPHIDHIVPLSRGGSHTEGNWALSCRSCNTSKSNRLLAEFRYRCKTRPIRIMSQ